MATETVDRERALVGRIALLDADPVRREAVSLGVVDALLERDGETLAAALDALRDARARAEDDRELAGWLDSAIGFAHWGLERVPSTAPVAHGTQAHDFLRALDRAPQQASADLGRRLQIDETQVSRAGRRLHESGLVTRSKVGRQVFWKLSPRGRQALDDAPPPARSPNADFWQEALRRGFESDPGDVNPTRRRILECALELHQTKGIDATALEDIAAEAGVPLETVEALFPTLDDLTRGCGAHFMERLELPPEDRAGAIFIGATSSDARIHRLVETLFAAYERGAAGITAGRNERHVASAVNESVDELDHTLEALVTEALRPLHPDNASVASVRALTDVEVWRTLRDQGATPESAITLATAAVERWLKTRPPG
jgi:AcrR family transcriptional regulator